MLEAGERITEADLYTGSVIVAVTFRTSLARTCGPYGGITGSTDMVTLSGHQLLFITGRVHDFIVRLNMHFDDNCTIQ